MQHEVFLVLGRISAVAILGLGYALIDRKNFRLFWFLAALGLYVIYDALLTRGFFQLENWPEGSDWNWLGKFLAIGGMLIVAALPAFGFKRCGVTLHHRPGSWLAYAVFAVLAAIIFYFAYTGGDGPADVETIMFQWTMPGFDEELFYRGVLLLALNEAFRSTANVVGVPMSFGAVLSSVLFGLAHAMGFGESGYSFDMMTFVMTGVPAMILVWMREKTGNLLLPVLVHNVANGAFVIF